VTKALRILHGEIKTPPMSVEARREAGFLLRQIQEGISLSLHKPRKSVANASVSIGA